MPLTSRERVLTTLDHQERDDRHKHEHSEPIEPGAATAQGRSGGRRRRSMILSLFPGHEPIPIKAEANREESMLA